MSSDNIRLTIGFESPGLDLEERDRETSKLMVALKELEGIERVNRVLEPDLPVMSKSAGKFLIGLLTAEINTQNAKSVLRFLSHRLQNKQVEMEVEANGKRLKVSARSPEDLAQAVEQAQKFIYTQAHNSPNS